MLIVLASNTTEGVASALTVPGDVSGDNWVGGDDLTIILEHWDQSDVTRGQGDLNGDNFVGGDDYTEVLTYWGAGIPPQSVTTAIPEPTTLVLLLLGGLAALIRRSRCFNDLRRSGRADSNRRRPAWEEG